VKKIKTIWNYSKNTEAIRILQIAYNIKNGFFQKQGFHVLPYTVPHNSRVIYFPKLNYAKIPDFWDKVKQTTQQLVEKNDVIIPQVEQVLPSKPLRYQHQQKQWKRVQNFFWKKCTTLLPSYFTDIRTLEIRPTQYGSIATGYSYWLKETHYIIVYARIDSDFSHIAEGIFLDRFKKLEQTNRYSWSQTEAIIDFILTETYLKTLFPSYKKTVLSLEQQQSGKLAIDSKKYLRTLKLPSQTLLTVKNKQIRIHNKTPSVIFTTSEKRLLYKLIKKRGSVVTYDEIAYVVWKNKADKKFSLYAISKLVQRIRRKITVMGLHSRIIQAIKTQGYILID